MFVRIILLFAALALVVAVAARQSSGAGHPQQYRVQAGDTLWSIATAHYAGDPRDAVWRIERRNHLGGTALEPGQVLVLPAG
jgi:nucleoid-associated protein YgaU